jgi:hypothetical protein
VSSVSNGLYFLTLPLVSVMSVIYTSNGMLKKFGVRVIYRKIRYFVFDINCYLVLFASFSLSVKNREKLLGSK